MNTINRRALVVAAPALLLGAPALSSPTTHDTPIVSLFRKHRAIHAAAGAYTTTLLGTDEDEELERLFYREADQVEEAMMAMPCTCPADFAAKVIVATARGEAYPNWENGPIWIEARALLNCEAY